MTDQSPSPYSGLIERLKAERYVREGRDEQDYVCDLACDAEDFGARAIPRNPDGPEAASAIRDLEAENARLRANYEALNEGSLTIEGALREALTREDGLIAQLEEARALSGRAET